MYSILSQRRPCDIIRSVIVSVIVIVVTMLYKHRIPLGK